MKPYYNEAFDFVNKFHAIPNAVFESLYNLCDYKELKHGEKLLNLGIVPQKIYFIAKGVVRSHLILSSGKEITTDLFNPFMFFGPFKALLKYKPTDLIYEALTTCHVFEIDYHVLYNFCKKDINLMLIYSKLLENVIIRSEDRFIDFSSNNAKERYLLLRTRISNLDNIMPQYQIAASLGITPVQLSRIRAKL